MSKKQKKALDQLEAVWKKIEEDFAPFHRDIKAAEDPISEFSFYVEMGKYPPPNVMVDLNEGFLNYFEAKGNKSLDESFFVSKHKKFKSLSFMQENLLRYVDFEWYLYENSFENLEDAAESFINKNKIEKDQDTFLRNYRRWKAKRFPPDKKS
jgi:hypothetical protein